MHPVVLNYNISHKQITTEHNFKKYSYSYMFRPHGVTSRSYKRSTHIALWKQDLTWGFGGLEVACWPLVPKFAGSHPAEAVGFLGRKIPQHAFLRGGSKAVGPMS